MVPYHFRFIGSRHSTCRRRLPTSKHTAEEEEKGQFPRDCGRESALFATPPQQSGRLRDDKIKKGGGGHYPHHHHWPDETDAFPWEKNSNGKSRNQSRVVPPSLFRSNAKPVSTSSTPRFQKSTLRGWRSGFDGMDTRWTPDGAKMEHSNTTKKMPSPSYPRRRCCKRCCKRRRKISLNLG